MMFHTVLVIIIVFFIALKVFSKLTMGKCTSPACLVGKTALITGGNFGIGYETALQLAERGCRVIIADKVNCDEAREKIIRKTDNKNIVAKQFDLASLSSVRNLAKDIIETEERLDILINNAGTLGSEFTYTSDNLLLEMQVNHFGSFLLTHLLVDLLKKSAPSIIIFVSSAAAILANLKEDKLNSTPSTSKFFSSQLMEYCNTKLCNIISARGFAKKLKGSGVTCNSLYPGVVYTTKIIPNYIEKTSKNYFDYAASWIAYFILMCFGKNSSEGTQTSVYLAVAKEVENVTGEYFVDCKPFYTPPKATNVNFATNIWNLSEDFVKLSNQEKL